jgi:hypothetical protein
MAAGRQGLSPSVEGAVVGGGVRVLCRHVSGVAAVVTGAVPKFLAERLGIDADVPLK